MNTVALAGNPNSGKTSLFNRLTGLRHRVGNYPGITVERRSGFMHLEGQKLEIVDLPGTYSLVPRSRDESLAFEFVSGLTDDAPDLVVCVVDASNLLRNLFVTLSLIEQRTPVVVALNMVDLAKAQGLEVSAERLSELLEVPVVPIVARTGEGLDGLKATMAHRLAHPGPGMQRLWRGSETMEGWVREVKQRLPETLDHDGAALWLLQTVSSLPPEDLEATLPKPMHVPAQWLQAALSESSGSSGHAQAIIEARYGTARRVVEQAQGKSPLSGEPSSTDRIDGLLLHPVFGLLFFVGIMGLLFQSIFAWADPAIGAIEGLVGVVQGGLRQILPPGALADLLSDGVVGGAGNVIVFVPQIAFLSFFIALLEDSGYLARAAFLSDRFMAKVGLHGRAFVPLLSGFACAVPAIMATRTIESYRDRLVTILVTPLISCSARLPVYTILIATLFASSEPVFGLVSVGGLMLTGLYLGSVLWTVLVAFILKRTLLKSPTPALVLELPPYRMPEMSSVLRRVVDRSWVFVKDAGTIIVACSIVLWALLYFPTSIPDSFSYETQKTSLLEAAPNDLQAQLTDLDSRAEAARLEASIAGRLGQAIQPAFEPLGYDWKIVVGLIASFAAREVFVSTMGLVYGMGGEVDDSSLPLRQRMQAEVHADTGKPVYTPLVGLSLMVFFMIALQCMSTVAAIRRETQSWAWAVFSFTYAFVLAWTCAAVVYQVGRLLGFS